MSCTCASPISTLNAVGTETGVAATAVAVAAAWMAADVADVAAIGAAAAVGAAAAREAAVQGTAAGDSVAADAGALLGKLAAGNVLAPALADTEGAAGALPVAISLLDEAAVGGTSVPAGVGAGCCGGKMGPSAGISALHVGQTCCMTSHERRQSMWNMCPHGNFFGFEASNSESLQMTQCSCCSISSSDASGKRISMLREMRRYRRKERKRCASFLAT